MRLVILHKLCNLFLIYLTNSRIRTGITKPSHRYKSELYFLLHNLLSQACIINLTNMRNNILRTKNIKDLRYLNLETNVLDMKDVFLNNLCNSEILFTQVYILDCKNVDT